jgi:iron-sulfur cluster repair protein YtfE (RIC family)
MRSGHPPARRILTGEVAIGQLARLRQEHAELVKLVGQLSEIINEPTPHHTIELLQQRRELSSALIAHLKAEGWVLYPRLAASSDPEIAATARALSSEMGGPAAAYMDCSERWGGRDRRGLDRIMCR